MAMILCILDHEKFYKLPKQIFLLKKQDFPFFFCANFLTVAHKLIAYQWRVIQGTLFLTDVYVIIIDIVKATKAKFVWNYF